MASMLKKIFAPVALGAAILGLAGCGETPQDLAAKPAIVQQMVENSASICETGPVHADKAAYEARLTKVLSRATTADLKTLQDKNITVCLDQRLGSQSTDFWHGRVYGAFYPGKDGGGIMTYRDNGMQPEESGFWSGNPAFYRGSYAVDRFASSLNNGKISATTPSTVQLYGKGSTPYWHAANTEDGSAMQRTPQLQQPPLKAPAVRPGS